MALPFDVEGTWYNSTVSLDAGELRRADSAMFGGAGSALGVNGGIVRHGDTSLSVTVDGSDIVTVQAGAVVIPGNAVSGTGCYRSALPTATTGNLAARNATNPRIDLVVFRALDTDVVPGHGAYKSRVEIIAGTPAASPGVPSLPSMAVELARITVPATGGGAASVDLTWRTFAHAVGAEMVVPSFARVPASAPKYQRARALDTGAKYEWDGSAWALAEFTDWTDATLGSGFSHGTGRIQYARRSGVVTVAIDAVKSTINTGDTVCTVPVGFRPSRTVLFVCISGAAANPAIRMQISSSGVVTSVTPATTVALLGSVTYPAV